MQRVPQHHVHNSSSSASAPQVPQLRPFSSSVPAGRAPHHPQRRGVVARSGSNGAENGRMTGEKQKEIARILLQTQKNMLELNNSRVKVQEELAMAHRRIADLETELERVRVEHAREQLKKAEQAAAAPATPAPAAPAPAAEQATTFVNPAAAAPAPAAPPAAAAPAAAPAAMPQQQQQQPMAQPQQMPQEMPQEMPQQMPQQVPQQMPQQVPQQMPQVQMQPPATIYNPPAQPPLQQQQQQQQPPMVQQQPVPVPVAAAAAAPPQQMAPAAPAPPAVINLTYISGWHNCFMHYTVDGKPWTSVPGQRMITSKTDHTIKTITIQGSKLEFVMTNGEDDWDSPGRYTDKPKNYAITAPGNYRLKSGKLDQLQ